MLDPEFDLQFWRVDENRFPRSIGCCDAWLLSGSPAAVYDDLPWIARLRKLLQELKDKAPLVGICFEHQLIADPFGAKAQRSERGRATGIHEYKLTSIGPCTRGTESQRVAVSHSDQATLVPPGAQVAASCERTPFASPA